MRVIQLSDIHTIINDIDIQALIKNQESAFLDYSSGLSVVPPVGYLEFSDPPGDCHIKYGYINGEDNFVIKVANGFYNNSQFSLPNNNGLMLVFNSKTGALKNILLDEGHLTDIRTAIAGLITAKYLSPKVIRGIGIFGTGVQAKLQLKYLKSGLQIADETNVWVWGRSLDKLQQYDQDLKHLNFNIHPTTKAKDILDNCNLIVTTTASKAPLFSADLVKPGTHITALGADSPGKQELDPAILGNADILVVDSLNQCLSYGDTSHAVKEKFISQDKPIELGNIINNPKLGRTKEDLITVADLTGIAVQDIKIAALMEEAAKEKCPA